MNKKAFTMIELVVVMTLVAILMFIGYISYVSYLGGSRDGSRVTQLQTIGEAIELSNAKGEIILPDDLITVSFSALEPYLFQGVIKQEKLKKMGYSGDGRDPKNKDFYTYSLYSNNRDYKLVAFLENSENLPKGNDYFDIYTTTGGLVPYFYGTRKGGLILDSNDIPVNINNVGTITFDCVSNTFSGYNIFYKNGDFLPLDSTQQTYLERPCYYDHSFSPSCEKQPTYVNAVFSEGVPDYDGNKIRRKSNLPENELDACAYTCTNGYKGDFCEIAPVYDCTKNPGYINANYIEGVPSSEDQSWQKTNSTLPCYYECTGGYTGEKCDIL